LRRSSLERGELRAEDLREQQLQAMLLDLHGRGVDRRSSRPPEKWRPPADRRLVDELTPRGGCTGASGACCRSRSSRRPARGSRGELPGVESWRDATPNLEGRRAARLGYTPGAFRIHSGGAMHDITTTRRATHHGRMSGCMREEDMRAFARSTGGDRSLRRREAPGAGRHARHEAQLPEARRSWARRSATRGRGSGVLRAPLGLHDPQAAAPDRARVLPRGRRHHRRSLGRGGESVLAEQRARHFQEPVAPKLASRT